MIPGLVDAHTHPVWLGDRGAEIGRRLAGVPYATIAAEGGGINATVRATRAGSDAELRGAVTARLAAMLAHGTTTAEAKSGYGLTEKDELAGAPPAASRSGRTPTSGCPASSHPPRRARGPAGVPATTAANGSGASPRRSSRRRRARGWRTSATSSASRASSPWRSRGASWRRRGERASASASTPTSSPCPAARASPRSSGPPPPTTCCSSRPRRSRRSRRRARWRSSCPGPPGGCARGARPARALIEAGVPVAVASDSNPGTCFTESLASVAVHACLDSGLTVEETLTGMTLNAAASLGLAHEVGSLEVGKVGGPRPARCARRSAPHLSLGRQPGGRRRVPRPCWPGAAP